MGDGQNIGTAALRRGRHGRTGAAAANPSEQQLACRLSIAADEEERDQRVDGRRQVHGDGRGEVVDLEQAKNAGHQPRRQHQRDDHEEEGQQDGDGQRGL